MTNSKSTDTLWNKQTNTIYMNFSPLCFRHRDSNLCRVLWTDVKRRIRTHFILLEANLQRDENAIAGLWETAHFLIHPSFMKWGIGEALFNNKINSSSGDSWIVSFWRQNPQPARTPNCYIHCFWFGCFFIKFMKSKQCVIETDF